ncbi:MAG: alcohol dehydrogenase catalytic domain-containing protein [Acutalibacteraceae bacterium]
MNEGCGVCGTDVHEWKGDPLGLIPVVLGHEGTGEADRAGQECPLRHGGQTAEGRR